VPKDVSLAGGSGGSQSRIGPRGQSLANDEAKHDKEKDSEGAAAEQNKAQGEKMEIRPEAGTGSQQPPNRTVRFPKPDHPVFLGSGQRRPSGATAPETTPTPRWCPPGLTPSQRRRIQRMRTQKLREEKAEKERDEHFNTIRPVVPAKQEWRVKKKTSTPALTASDDDMDLLDDDESPLIKDRSP
jgi:hypothetical protein